MNRKIIFAAPVFVLRTGQTRSIAKSITTWGVIYTRPEW